MSARPETVRYKTQEVEVQRSWVLLLIQQLS